MNGFIPDKAEIIVVFTAVCPEDNPYYWKAELTIPPETTPETILSLFIKDGKETPILSGKFVLFDLELSIEDGVAEIRFDQFLTDLKKHSVKLVFPDETESKGTLRYF